MTGPDIFLAITGGCSVICPLASIRWRLMADGYALREFNREAVRSRKVAGDWLVGAIFSWVALGIAMAAKAAS